MEEARSFLASLACSGVGQPGHPRCRGREDPAPAPRAAAQPSVSYHLPSKKKDNGEEERQASQDKGDKDDADKEEKAGLDKVTWNRR